MNFDTPLVEYLIIGTHTTAWIFLLGLKVFKLPLSALSKLDPASLLILLPFLYIIGMVFDDVVYRMLSGRMIALKKEIFGSKKYPDESIAYESEVLYNAYEARIRRVRIIGAAIFNWPLLCIAFLLNIEFDLTVFLAIITTTVILTILSWSIWNGLNNRAYKFRKNAIDVIAKSKTGK